MQLLPTWQDGSLQSDSCAKYTAVKPAICSLAQAGTQRQDLPSHFAPCHPHDAMITLVALPEDIRLISLVL